MESKLLSGGKNILDHTNEQHRELEQRRKLISEQNKKERMLQQDLEEKEEVSLRCFVFLLHEVSFHVTLRPVTPERHIICHASSSSRRFLCNNHTPTGISSSCWPHSVCTILLTHFSGENKNMVLQPWVGMMDDDSLVMKLTSQYALRFPQGAGSHLVGHSHWHLWLT